MLLELPRLTNSLRLPFDADQAYLNRKTYLQDLSRRSSAASLGEWELARKIIYRWDEASVEVRQLYKQFIAAVVELMGGEVVSEEFQEVALNAYRLFGAAYGSEEDDGDKRILAKRFELQKLIGHTIPDTNILKVASLVERLSALQKNEHGTGYLPELVSEVSEDLEFGADLVFRPPARFLVDISLEDAEILVEETSTSSSNHERWSDYGASANFHPSHRKDLVESIHRGLLVLKSDKSTSNTQVRLPSYATQVTVQTESERQIDKLRRKEEKKHRRGTDHGIENELSSLSFSSLLQASEKKNFLDDIVGHGDGTQFAATALPQGTVRKHYKGYEEVTIPPTPTAPMKPGEKLVCAPTGAGKTNIAMISILHEGYPGKFYCPRMNSMNKPTYAAICTHSPTKPVLIFVSSRRQTRLTALDLIQYAASDEHPRQFLSIPEESLQMVLSQVADQNLRHTLQFGIGLHHAGLNDKDRSLVEELK
ncbi:UNVERIFIED_CONTAM: DExH-box ATP-dependent RNA helicase DExH14 [Sesamum radiatum]|uniref:DExH-box ATP-dependent RNA helicase DExH14 n=1 Tax=Sesamum radiatum TaxID=300843 RepID=A0AAW2MW97_SESRA